MSGINRQEITINSLDAKFTVNDNITFEELLALLVFDEYCPRFYHASLSSRGYK